MNDVKIMRIRIYFCKNEAMRFTGHLDLHKTWERIFRRAGLPLAYSQGFHPQPRLNLACALPLGFTSQAEILDAWLEEFMSLEDVQAALANAAPPGITLEKIEAIDLRVPALQTQVCSSEYRITFLTPVAELDQKVNDILAAKSILRRRRDRNYDLRPLIEDLKIEDPKIEDLRCLPDTQEGFACLTTRLTAREGATGRPEELIDALGVQPSQTRVHRMKLFFL